MGVKIYSNPNIRMFWQFVGALQIGTATVAGLNAGSKAGHYVQIILAIISTVGGSMIAESSNLLILAQDTYTYPRGPSGNFLLSLWGALFHLVLTGSITIPYITQYIKIDSIEDVTGLLIVALTVVSILYPPTVVQDVTSKVMEKVPGVSAVVQPMDINLSNETMPWPLDQGLWGYDISSPAEYLFNAAQYDRVFTTEESEDASEDETPAPKSAKKETPPTPAPVEEKKSSGRNRAASRARK